ncbi:hypothetical protein DM02DRAFT_698312 [Periconia macrospinosa]|uniref:DNA2/NAM7 helicase-like C-terminal domain-containing protein n=1 Tax=Periconia macrospinosa TaxID=97972 RepID=A0A2V1D473_9PLEO|nr:hypothetical protein DM02DRAFT_698312 [Periconia macrospinosa]
MSLDRARFSSLLTTIPPSAEPVMVAMVIPDTLENRSLESATVATLPDLFPESVVLVNFGLLEVSEEAIKTHTRAKGSEDDQPSRRIENIKVKMAIRGKSYVKSILEYKFTVDHGDRTMTDGQSKHIVRVHVTPRNAQPRKSDGEGPKPFIDLHKCINVTNELELLETIFPRAREGYIAALCETCQKYSQTLHLIVIPHNEKALASNLFITKPNMPTDHTLLAKVLRQTTCILTLMKSRIIPVRMKNIYRDFKEEIEHDPLDAFFDGYSDHIRDGNIAEKEKRPKFQANARAFFETWTEYKRIVGIAMIIEQRFHGRNYEYWGDADIIPLRNTYSKSSELYMGYTIFFSPEETKEVRPSLTANTAVLVSFAGPFDIALNVWWKGKVTSATVGAAQDDITIVVQRPSLKLHSEEVSTLKRKSFGRRVGHTTRLDDLGDRKQIKVFLEGNPSELERLTSNFTVMDSESLFEEDSEVESKWKDTYKDLLLGKEYDTLVQSGLYEDVKDSGSAIHFLKETLRPYQMEWVQKLVSGGLIARLAALTGPSGSGKSTAMFAAVLPYMLHVLYDPDEFNASHHLATLLRTQYEERAKKKDNKEALLNEEDIQESFLPNTEPMSKDEDSFSNVSEPQWVQGRVTIVAVQNESVENAFEEYKEWCERFASFTGHPPFLGFRMYALEIEVSAVLAMIHPDFDESKAPNLPYFMGDPNLFTDEVTKKHTDNFLKSMNGSGYEGIRDRRFQNIRASMAHGVLQLAGMAPLSPAMKAAFTRENLSQAFNALVDLRDARLSISQNNMRKLDYIGKRHASYAARKGLLFLLERASYIVTSIGVATQPSFIRSTTALACEEAGRVNDAEFLGLFSHFLFTKVHIVNGSPNQLPPMVFGPETENPFQKQLELSTLTRLVETGFPVLELMFTARFRNEELLNICNFVNRATYSAADGSFHEVKTAQAKKAMQAVWGVDSPVVYLDLAEPYIKYTPTRSAYNKDCAAIALHSILNMVASGICARDISYITPYNAQLDFFSKILEKAIEKDRAASYKLILEQKDLRYVTKSTVDSYMGKNNEYIILDTCGLQKGFLYDERRFLVALTRARTGMVVIGDMEDPYGPWRKIHKPDHPLYAVLKFIKKAKCLRVLSNKDKNEFQHYLKGVD